MNKDDRNRSAVDRTGEKPEKAGRTDDKPEGSQEDGQGKE
jgi:hypothetical protein